MFYSVLAEAGANTLDLATTLQTALQGVQSNVQSMIGVAMPIGLGIMGTILAIRVGARFFRGLVS